VFDVMKEAHDLGFFWGMVTNAVLIDDRVVRKMEQSGMDTVSVSIDGDEKAHAVLRGSAENYRRAMQGLEMLVKHGSFLECVQVTSVIGSHNVDILERMYDRFASMGVGEWRLLMIDPIGRMLDAENRGLLLNGDQLGRLLEFVAAKRSSGPMPITFEESGFLGLKYEGLVRGYYFHCPAGINIGSILHDGKIGACPSLERHMIEGDARTERFSKVWNERFLRYRDRESTRRKGQCAACKWWKHCEGGSLHLWDWDAGRPRVCHYSLLRDAGCV
jgi:radical SAM protein with 4Fe4S-binding SPASM domain